MRKKSYNYKIIIGIVIGFLLVSFAYASSEMIYSDIIYNGSNSEFSDGSVQGALDDLKVKIESNRSTLCPEGYYCDAYKNSLALGDYVYYRPKTESYSINKSITGYTGTESQIIYPNELRLWRVLNINNDGTVDLISEYASSTEVYFEGQTGYLNLVGYLNELAKQYETEGITDETKGSRHFGYNGQTEYLDPNTVIFNSAPWTCSSGESCENSPVENEGGGDMLYTTDYDRLFSVLGNRIAMKVGTTTSVVYWMASRNYLYESSTNFRWIGRFVGKNAGTYGNNDLYYYTSPSFNSYSSVGAIRPIVTLKSGLSYGNGLGTERSPMKILTS